MTTQTPHSRPSLQWLLWQQPGPSCTRVRHEHASNVCKVERSKTNLAQSNRSRSTQCRYTAGVVFVFLSSSLAVCFSFFSSPLSQWPVFLFSFCSFPTLHCIFALPYPLSLSVPLLVSLPLFPLYVLSLFLPLSIV